MKRVIFALVCLAIMAPVAQAGEAYRWVDKAGKVHYSDVPPADVSDVERRRLSSTASQNEALPYETQRAKQNFPVTLYVGSGCGQTCDEARRLLSKRGIPFTEKMLKTREDVEAFKRLSGIDGVPVLSVGKSYLRGFLAEQWHKELDTAGYPKTASYRQRVAPVSQEALPAENQEPPAKPAAP